MSFGYLSIFHINNPSFLILPPTLSSCYNQEKTPTQLSWLSSKSITSEMLPETWHARSSIKSSHSISSSNQTHIAHNQKFGMCDSGSNLQLVVWRMLILPQEKNSIFERFSWLYEDLEALMISKPSIAKHAKHFMTLA